MEMKTISNEICISREECEDMQEYMERLRETIDVLSSRKTVQKLESALKRVESGEFLTKDDLVF